MASQITHIIYADKFLKANLDKWERSKFLVGTIFPDIRYLGVIEREKTHQGEISLRDVRESEKSFESGMKFHAWLDEVREPYLVKCGAYGLCSDSPMGIRALKLFEDELLYGEISDWTSVRSYFDRVLTQEEGFGIEEKSLLHWHRLNQSYFSQPPTNESRGAALLGVGFTAEKAVRINQELVAMRENKDLISILREFEAEFSELIKRQ